jgi:hypothetical protein
VSKERILLLEIVDLETMKMRIDMHTLPGLDYALNMLAQATRVLEARQRFLSDQEMVNEQMQKMADQQLVSLAGGRKQ